MWATGECQRNDLGHHVGDQIRVFLQLFVLFRKLVKAKHPRRDRIARGVVAADDQQQHVAQKLVGWHVFGGLAISEKRDQVEPGLRLPGAFLPNPREVLETLPDFGEAFLDGGEVVRVGDAFHGV